ncbi:putative transposase [Wolbachia endosymbiont of Cylisticus convexus]|nr:Transposase [Wolbachia endosymbiont of Cylisticus convexus]RDD33798.1 Transposase [Wolbachia endosymbiont of Cylisticus convexus]RDD34402.1 Transposase [Wolbachia endosymbiont of Cylisticus convexus]RDD34467.1 Transposase [Wolbachia endosymbiont of Cylisticus convexus]RDD34629.1 transposase [Wolbachia endosymbiont of Cylisticus convexus]
MKEKTIAKRFKIGKTTLYEWKKRREKTGDFQSKTWAITIKLPTGMHLQGGKTQSEMLVQY